MESQLPFCGLRKIRGWEGGLILSRGLGCHGNKEIGRPGLRSKPAPGWSPELVFLNAGLLLEVPKADRGHCSSLQGPSTAPRVHQQI